MKDHDKIASDIRENGATLKTVCLSEVKPVPINWLWPEKIARGKTTLWSGDPGLGKSLLTTDLAARVSIGARWPVGDGNAPIGSTILLSDEDAMADTIRPRLDAAGADCTKIHGLLMVQDYDSAGQAVERGFCLAKDAERLRKRILEIGDVALVVIDPISAYLQGIDTHKNSDVRTVLSPLSRLAEDLKVAVVVVTHLNKGSGSAMYRSVGSIAFTAAARSAWAVTKCKDDPARRLVLPVKNNIGSDSSGMAYRIETADNGAPRLIWEPDPVEIDINEALAAETEDYRSEREDAMEWLREELKNGPQPADKMLTNARAAGHSQATVRRAKQALDVESTKSGMAGGWLWALPNCKGSSATKMLTKCEGAQSKKVSTFGSGEHLRRNPDDLPGVEL